MTKVPALQISACASHADDDTDIHAAQTRVSSSPTAHAAARCCRCKRRAHRGHERTMPSNVSQPAHTRTLHMLQRPIAGIAECALQESPPR
jgi:hypothetical protein